MTRLVMLWLLLAGLVGISVQQCTTEDFEEMAPGIIETTIGIQNVSIIRITYNCLSPSPTADGTFTSISVSILYNASSSELHGIRYDMECKDKRWSVFDNSTSVVIDGVTRANCTSCLDPTVNDEHCTSKCMSHCQ